MLQLQQSVSCAPSGYFQTLDFYIPMFLQREGLIGDNLSRVFSYWCSNYSSLSHALLLAIFILWTSTSRSLCKIKSLNGDNLSHAIPLELQLEQSVSCAPIWLFSDLWLLHPEVCVAWRSHWLQSVSRDLLLVLHYCTCNKMSHALLLAVFRPWTSTSRSLSSVKVSSATIQASDLGQRVDSASKLWMESTR